MDVTILQMVSMGNGLILMRKTASIIADKQMTIKKDFVSQFQRDHNKLRISSLDGKFVEDVEA